MRVCWKKANTAVQMFSITLNRSLQIGGYFLLCVIIYGPTDTSGVISNKALYILHFMNMSTDRNTKVNQSIYVSSFNDTKIRLDAPTIHLTDYASLDASNTPARTYFKYFTQDIGVPRGQSVSRNAIQVVSDGTPIWVQVNKMEQGTTAAYLALPVTKHATEFFIPSYHNRKSTTFHSGFAVAGLDDGTCMEIYAVNGNDYRRLHLVNLDALDVYTATDNTPYHDYTGYFVNSTKPMAVYGGNECAYIPSEKGFCDGIIEQVPPVIEWGTEFIIPPIAGRGGVAGYEFRVIAKDQNTEVNYTLTAESEVTVTIDRGQDFLNATSGPGNNQLTSTVYITCSKKCLVVQYNKGAEADGRSPPNKNNGTKTDPFMMIIPPLNHYDKNMRFTTMKHYNSDHPIVSVDYISIVAKYASCNGLRLDGEVLKGVWRKVTGKQTYAYYTQSLAPGFHKLTHTNNNEEFMAWVYGHGTADYTGYGYMAGYKITDVAVDDVSGRYNVEPTTTVTPVTSTSPWILGNWTDEFHQEDFPKYSIIFWGEFHIPERGSSYSISQQVCSNGYNSFFKEKRLPTMAKHLENNLDRLCGASTRGSMVELSTYNSWFYTEYTRGNLSFALTLIGGPLLSFRDVASCAMELKQYTEDSRNWPTVAGEDQVNNRTFLMRLTEYMKETKCDEVEMGPLNNQLHYNFFNAAGQSWLCNSDTVESYGKSVMTSGGSALVNRLCLVQALALTLLCYLVSMRHA